MKPHVPWGPQGPLAWDQEIFMKEMVPEADVQGKTAARQMYKGMRDILSRRSRCAMTLRQDHI